MIEDLISLERVAPAALPSLLMSLWRDGRERVQVSIASAPVGVHGECALTVRPLSTWKTLFDLAGFDVAFERSLNDPVAADAWTAEAHWARFNPFRGEGDRQRRIIALRRRPAVQHRTRYEEMLRTLGVRPPSRMGPRPLHPDTHLVFLVGTYQEFRQYQSLWPALPNASFTVLVRDGGSDTGWVRRSHCMAAWLTARGMSWLAVSDVNSVPWSGWDRARPVLVVGADSSVFRSHMLNGAFVATARARGWKTVQLQHGIWPYADATAPLTMVSEVMLTWSGEFRTKLGELVSWPDGTTQRRGRVDGTRFITAGCPAFDRYADAYWPRLHDLLGDWVERYRRRVLVATNLHWSQHREGERANPAILDLARQHEDTLFIVKTHPAHDPDDGFVQACPPNVQVLDEFCCLFADLDSARLVLATDAVICTLSTIALEAAVAQRPFIVIDTGNPNSYEHVVPVAPDRLAAAFASLLDSPPDMKAFVDHYVGPGTVGRATRAVFDAIASEQARPHAPLDTTALQPFVEFVSAQGVETFALEARVDELERRLGETLSLLDHQNRALDAARQSHERLGRIVREKDVTRLASLSRPARVGLFGASSAGIRCLEDLRAIPSVHVCCFFDNDPAQWGSAVDGVRVRKPSSEAFDQVDFILVSSVHVDAISRQIVEAGYGAKLVLDPVVLTTAPDTVGLLS